MRRAARIDNTQTTIVNALRAYGYTVVIIREPVDIAVKIKTRVNMWVMMEIKTPKPSGKFKPRKDQQAQTDFCLSYSIPYITTIKEALDYMSNLI